MGVIKQQQQKQKKQQKQKNQPWLLHRVINWFSYPKLETIEPQLPFRTKLHALLHDDNPYLRSGYRYMPINSLWKCLVSMFQLHNETMNIHTHFLPLFLWLYYLFWVILPHTEEEMPWVDKSIFVYYLIGACCTMIMSAMYHTFRANSEPCYHFCLACDLRGIVMLLSGANILTVHFGLSCWPHLRRNYLSVNFAAMAVLLVWISHMVKYRLTNQRTIYFSVFSFLGLAAWIHRMMLMGENLSILEGFELDLGTPVTKFDQNMSIFWGMLFIPYMITLIGIIVRSLKAPERFVPYLFDIFGASHQLFHIITVIGAWTTLYPAYLFYQHGVFEKLCPIVHT